MVRFFKNQSIRVGLDSVTGLDYYNARYYDPVVGRFLSPDDVQGNTQAMDPYAYVSGNPETLTDPTGHRVACGPDGCGSNGPPNPNDCNADPSLSGCPGSGGNGGGCTYNGKPCSSTNNPCDAKTTTWNGSQCVAKPDHSQKKKDARNAKLLPKTLAGAGLLALGGIISILVDFYALKKGFDDGDLLEMLGAIADGLSVLSDVVGAISLISSAAGAIAYAIETGLHAMLTIVNGALWAYNLVMSGWTWAKGVVTAALKFIGLTVQGVPGQLFKLAGDLFGKSLISGGRAIGHGLMVAGNAILTDVAYQESMNVNDWCTRYGQDQAACALS